MLGGGGCSILGRDDFVFHVVRGTVLHSFAGVTLGLLRVRVVWAQGQFENMGSCFPSHPKLAAEEVREVAAQTA